jgi:hypothetical protein
MSSFLIAATALAGTACSGLRDIKTLPAATGRPNLERGIYAVYVDDSGLPGESVAYRAGTAVCIAPDTLVTSSSLFHHSLEGAVTADTGSVTVGDDTNSAPVEDIEIRGQIAVISIGSTCRSVKHGDGLAKNGDKLTMVSAAYDGTGSGRHARAALSVREATVISAISAADGRISVQAGRVPGQAGAAMLDSSGRLVGITLYRHGSTVAVATIGAVIDALSSEGGAR